MSFRCGINGLPSTGKTTISNALEGELQEFSPEERQEFLAELGLTETGIARLVRESSRLLGLVTFYTIVGPEVRAWHMPVETRLPGPPARSIPTWKKASSAPKLCGSPTLTGWALLLGSRRPDC
ncbi:MAG: hypothetical protein WC600_01740 [Desulfobaccales bacterium]